jgi:hypothetical protein
MLKTYRANAEEEFSQSKRALTIGHKGDTIKQSIGNQSWHLGPGHLPYKYCGTPNKNIALKITFNATSHYGVMIPANRTLPVIRSQPLSPSIV